MPDCHSGGREFESRRPRHLTVFFFFFQGEFMFTIFLISVLWLSLTYRYGLESVAILVLLDAIICFVYRKLRTDDRFHFRKRLVFTFMISFLIAFITSFKVIIMWFFRKIHRGIYEVTVEDTSRLDQFFLSTSVTIVPDTIYLDRIGDVFLIHKIDKIYFLSRKK